MQSGLPERSCAITTQSPHLNLIKATLQDPFVTADIASNWDKVDSSPGSFICTSSTRPAWGSPNLGQSIIETDTGLRWRWTGAAFVRQDATGLLSTAAGGQAFRNSVVDVTNTTGAWTSLLSVTGVVVPPGNRPLRITATCAMSQGKSASWQLGIFRSAVSNAGTMEREWIINGAPVPNYKTTFYYGTNITDWNADGGTYVAYLPTGLTAGTYDWSFQLRNTGSLAASVLTTAHDNSPSTSLAIGPTLFVEEV